MTEFIVTDGKNNRIGVVLVFNTFKDNKDIIMKCTKVSCFGDVMNVGIDPKDTKIDAIGRICQERPSQKPGSSLTFLDPIQFGFIKD